MSSALAASAWAEEPKQHAASDSAVTRKELLPEVIPLLVMRRPSRHTRSAMPFPSFCTKGKKPQLTNLLQMQLQCVTAPVHSPDKLHQLTAYSGMIAAMGPRAQQHCFLSYFFDGCVD